MDKLKEYGLFYAGLAIAGAMVVSAIIGSFTLSRLRALDNVLVATGSAKQAVTADRAKWTIQVSRVVSPEQVSYTYAQVSADSAKVKKFLLEAGLPSKEITVSPIFVDEYWSPDQQAKKNVRQTVSVDSAEVAKVDQLSKRTISLAQQGVIFSPQAPEYFVSQLAQLRVSLLGEAIKDARARVDQIAKASGQSVGRLKGATGGVVQVLTPNSINIDDYGQYDTSSIDKEVMVTVRATFLTK